MRTHMIQDYTNANMQSMQEIHALKVRKFVGVREIDTSKQRFALLRLECG